MRAGDQFQARKPMAAPVRAAASSRSAGSAPEPTLANSSKPAPSAAASLPANPSIPSIKLNRLIHQTQTSPLRASWDRLCCSGRTARPIITAPTCTNSRTSGESPRRSSIQETTAKKAAPSTIPRTLDSADPVRTSTIQASNTEPVTAIPPPRGVATLCDDLSLGRSRISRRARIGIRSLVTSQATKPVAVATTVGHTTSSTGGRWTLGRGDLLGRIPSSFIPRQLIFLRLICDRPTRLAADRPAHGDTPGRYSPAQHHLLGPACLSRAEIDAFAKAHFAASGAQPPYGATR